MIFSVLKLCFVRFSTFRWRPGFWGFRGFRLGFVSFLDLKADFLCGFFYGWGGQGWRLYMSLACLATISRCCLLELIAIINANDCGIRPRQRELHHGIGSTASTSSSTRGVRASPVTRKTYRPSLAFLLLVTPYLSYGLRPVNLGIHMIGMLRSMIGMGLLKWIW